MDKCKNCNWYYSDTCCSESLDELGNDSTYMTDSCVGFLRKDFIEHMIDMKSELLVYCKDESLINHIKNMSYVETEKTYKEVFNM